MASRAVAWLTKILCVDFHYIRKTNIVRLHSICLTILSMFAVAAFYVITINDITIDIKNNISDDYVARFVPPEVSKNPITQTI